MYSDGFASVIPHQTKATLKNATHLVRLTRPTVAILESTPLRIRLLDLTNWTLTTVIGANTPQSLQTTSPSLSISPYVTINASTLRILKSDQVVQLHCQIEEKTYVMDLETGEVEPFKQLPNFPPHDLIVPIPSTPNRPVFKIVKGARSILVELLNGVFYRIVDTSSVTECLAHASGTELTVFRRDVPILLYGGDRDPELPFSPPITFCDPLPRCSPSIGRKMWQRGLDIQTTPN